MVNDIAVQEFVNAIKEAPTDSNTTYSAKVSRVDNNGVVWVNLFGSEKETPTASTSSEVKRGDSVTVNWRNNRLYIGGNYSNPSAGITTVQPSVNYVNQLVSKNVTAESITASTGYIGELTANNITAESISADHAMIQELDVESMSAAVAYIGDLTAENITADDIVADHATVDSLDTNYAQINLANVNNAWIQNGVIKNGAIADAQIIGVSANKLTAGTIDASNITVTNLNASNITTGSITVDGITIDVTNNEASIDGSYIDDGTITLSGLAQEVTDKIDGAIETFTGNAVPTLNNYPASSWTTSTVRDTHIGDIYYVINAGNQADGYCYRFAKSGNTYQWVLIKDSDVTAALGRLTTAEGKITGLESFESTTSSWITDTDEELSSLKTNVTSLTTRVGDAEDEIETKVDTSTFNNLSQTVGENSASITSLTTITTNNGLTSSTNITNTVNNVSQTATSNSTHLSQLTTTLGTNADGTTKTGDIVHRTSAVEQDLSGFHTTVEETYATKTALNGKADASTVYTKSEIDQTVSGINASVSAKADGQATTAALALKANKDTLTSEINASADTVKISADKVNIEGATIFTGNGRLSQTSLDNAYEEHGAVADLVTDLASASGTTVINGGHIDTGSIAIGKLDTSAQNTISNAAMTATSYITDIDTNSGITIKAVNGTTDTDPDTANYLKLNAIDGLNIYKGGASVAQYGDTVRVGKEVSGNVYIDSDSIDIRDGQTVLASFGEPTRIGEDAVGFSRTLIDANGIRFYRKASASNDVCLANIGYGTGKSQGGTTATAPYYYFGDRDSSAVPGNFSLGEGYRASAKGWASHAEGHYATAEGAASHAQGEETIARGYASHAGGYATIASGENQTVIGRYNIEDTTSLFIIGNGDIATTTRSNALTVSPAGDVNIASGAKYKINGTALAPSDLGEADWITSKGTSGDWYYEKWASGKVEAYFYGQLTGSTPTQTNTYYYRSSNNSFTIPSGIFPATPICVGTNINSSNTVMFGFSIKMTSATAGTWQIFRTNNNAVSFNAGAHFVYTP